MRKLFCNSLCLIFLCSLLVVSAGCSSPKIDGTTDESFEKSLKEVADSLSTEKREEFTKVFGGMALMYMLAKNGDEKAVRQFFHGMTYEDVMDKAAEVEKRLKNGALKK